MLSCSIQAIPTVLGESTSDPIWDPRMMQSLRAAVMRAFLECAYQKWHWSLLIILIGLLLAENFFFSRASCIRAWTAREFQPTVWNLRAYGTTPSLILYSTLTLEPIGLRIDYLYWLRYDAVTVNTAQTPADWLQLVRDAHARLRDVSQGARISKLTQLYELAFSVSLTFLRCNSNQFLKST